MSARNSASRRRTGRLSAPYDGRTDGLAGALTTLRNVEADLQLIVARLSPDKPGEGVVFTAFASLVTISHGLPPQTST